MNVLMILATTPENTHLLRLQQLYERIGERKRLRSSSKSEKKKFPLELRKRIVDFLASLPNVHDSDFQQAFIKNAELDDELESQIAYGTSSSQFFSLMVSMLTNYGTLEDGRNALEAILEAAKQYIGQDKKVYGEQLISAVREATDFSKIPQHHNLSYNDSLLKFRAFRVTHIQDIQRAFLDFPSNILHFVGQGIGTPGIQLEDNFGNKQILQSSILVEMLKSFANQVECVILDTCYDTSQAETIAQYIPYTIGLPSLLKEKISIEFTAAFYDALDAGKSIEFAYNVGRNAIYMAGVSEDVIPILFHTDIRKDSELDRLSKADQFYRAGLKYFEQNDYNSAQNVLMKTLSIRPEYLDAAVLLGRVYLAKQDSLQAIEILEEVYQQDPIKSRDFLIQALKAQIALSHDDSQQLHLYERIEQIRDADRSLLQLQKPWEFQRQSMQGYALLEIELLNQQEDLIWQDELVLKFRIKNTGNAPANKVQIAFFENEAYHICGAALFKTDFIAPGDHYDVTFRIRPLQPAFTLNLSYAYSDVIEKQEFFDRPVQLLSQPAYQFERLVNPYRSGNLTQELQRGHTEMFFGRRETIRELQRILIENDEGLVIIYGQRRSGKSCLMKYIEKTGAFEPDVHMVFVDMQGISSEQRFYVKVLKQLAKITNSTQEIRTKIASFDEFTASLEELTGAANQCILIMIDEFERVTSDHFRYISLAGAHEFINRMRNLIQYTPDVKFALSGADGLKEMVDDYRNPLFKAGRTFHIARLHSQDARDLITQPLADKITYTEQAITAIQDASYNQPYYIQCLCQKIVWLLNQKESYTVTLTEVREAIEDIEKTERDMFEYVWDITGKDSHLVLAILAEEMRHRTWISVDRIEKIIQEGDVHINGDILDGPLQELLERDFAVDNGNLEYRIPIGLLSTWIKRYKPLKRVRRELA